MKNIPKSLPFYLTKFKYEFFPFDSQNNSSVILTINDSTLYCAVDIFNDNQHNLQVNYSNSFHKNKRNQNKEILISRAIDKIFRPYIYRFNCSINIHVICLRGQDNVYYASMVALLAMRYLFPINIGICYMSISDDTYMFAKNHLYNTSIFIAANREEIISLELHSRGNSLKVTEEIILQAIEKAMDIYNIIMIIKPKYEFFSVPNVRVRFNLLEQKYNETKYNPESLRKCASSYLANNTINENLRNISIKYQDNDIIFSRGKTTCYANYFFNNDTLNNININYGFYKFSTNSNYKPSRRREIGHGNMINKIISIAMNNSKVPININCEILSSDGSSSMASVCAASSLLYTMDLCENISGISVGLFKSKSKHKLKVDLKAQEDKYSEMDCKIASNNNNILGVYLDTKSYLPVNLLRKSLELGYKNNKVILEHMNKEIKPIYKSLICNNIGYLVGPKGVMIKYIKQITNSNIQIFGSNVIYENKPMVKDILNTFTKQLVIDQKYYFPFKNSELYFPYIKSIIVNGEISKNIHQVKIVQLDKNKMICNIID